MPTEFTHKMQMSGASKSAAKNLGGAGKYDPDKFGCINLGSDYTVDEIEFLKAVEKFKKDKKVRFPTYSQILRVLLSLGYRKQSIDATDATNQGDGAESSGN